VARVSSSHYLVRLSPFHDVLTAYIDVRECKHWAHVLVLPGAKRDAVLVNSDYLHPSASESRHPGPLHVAQLRNLFKNLIAVQFDRHVFATTTYLFDLYQKDATSRQDIVKL
jgi:hypothetical protein